MKKINKICVLLLSLALVLTGLQITPEYQALAAKKKMKLTKKLTLKVGKKKKLKIKNKKGKVKWKSSKKKVATVSKKGVVKAKKVGKTTITAQVTYKKKKTKLKCKVTVVKKGKQTKKPTKKPVVPTPKKTPAKTPGKTPSRIDTSKAVEWNTEKQGDFLVSGISFTDKSLTYQISDEDDVILVDTGTKASVKAVVPDLSKCTFEVYAAGKNYAETVTGDIKWSDKSYHPNNRGNGYYTFKLYIVSGGKTYYRTYKMAEKLKTLYDNGKNFTITAIQAGGKELTPSRDRADAWHYMLELTSGATSVKALIPELEKAKLSAVYMGKKVTIEKIKDIEWVSYSYYDDYDEGTGYYSFTVVARNGAQQIEVSLFLSDYNENLAVEEFVYSLGGTNKTETVRDYASVLALAVEKGKTLKQVFPDVSAAFTFTCFYHDRLYKNIKATEVKWTDTPYWENDCDSGYYTFTLAVTGENGKQIKRTFYLVEEYQTVMFSVSGTLKSGAGELVEGETLTFGTSNAEIADYKTKTGAGGAYQIDLPEGEWDVYWNKYMVDTITVGKQPLTHNIEAKNMVKVSGTVSRLGKAWTDCDVELYGDETIFVHTDAKTGAYSVYLPKDEYFYIYVDDWYMGKTLSPYEEDAASNVTRDISCDFVQISGTIYQSGTTPFAEGAFYAYAEGQWDDEGRRFYTDADGKYRIYVSTDIALTIEHVGSESIIGEITVANQDITKNMEVGVTHITGVLTVPNGDVLQERTIYFEAGNNQKGSAETDEDGRYSAYLKPGTYTASVWCGEYVELSQKVTVGTASAVYNLQAPLYQVSGTIKNRTEPWGDKDFVLWWEGADEDGGSYIYTNEEGEYYEYLPAKTYTVYPDGFSKESGVELKVERDMTKDIQFAYQEVKGHIYRTAGTEFESDSGVFLWIEDPDGNEVSRLFVEYDKDYQLYVDKPGEYTVYYGSNGESLATFTVAEDTPVTTHDIVCNIYRVAGNVTGLRDGKERGLIFEGEDGMTWPVETGEVTDEKMPYFVYLPAGDYQAYISEGEEPEKLSVSVTKDIESFNIAAKATYRISGTLSRPSGVWGGQTIAFQPEYGSEGQYSDATTKSDGTYEAFLSAGTYIITVGDVMVQDDDGNALTVQITDSDVSKDISMDVIEISGTVTKKDGKPMADTYFYIEAAENNGGSISNIMTNEKGAYKGFVKPSCSYKIMFNGEEIDTFTSGNTDMTKNLTINVVKVSGKFKNADGDAIPEANIYFCKQGTDSEINAFTEPYYEWEEENAGNYSLYLSPGTYDVKYENEIVFTNLQVGEQDMEQDIVCSN